MKFLIIALAFCAYLHHASKEDMCTVPLDQSWTKDYTASTFVQNMIAYYCITVLMMVFAGLTEACLGWL